MPRTRGAITQARPSRPRNGPSGPIFVQGLTPGGRKPIFRAPCAMVAPEDREAVGHPRGGSCRVRTGAALAGHGRRTLPDEVRTHMAETYRIVVAKPGL